MCGKLAIKTSKIVFFGNTAIQLLRPTVSKTNTNQKRTKKMSTMYIIFIQFTILYIIYMLDIKWMMMRPKTIVSFEYRPCIEVAVHNTNGKNKVRLCGLVIEFPTR